MTSDSLVKHLAGGYVRSDSLAKYRRWLAGSPAGAVQMPLVVVKPTVRQRATGMEDLTALRLADGDIQPAAPHLVIDLFSGCGGLSLGFDSLGDGRVFRTVLAMDVEEPMVRAFNDNFPAGPARWPVARRVDLSDFLNEAEVLAFYLDHLAAATGDTALAQELANLPEGSLGEFKRLLHERDAAFLEALAAIRASREFVDAYAGAGASAMGQTSVIGFHTALRLPLLSSRRPEPAPIIWADCTEPGAPRVAEGGDGEEAARVNENRVDLRREWDREVAQLRENSKAMGRGQLASSAGKIGDFVRLLDSSPLQKVRDAWVEWRAVRDAARERVFGSARTLEALRRAYTPDRHVSVILGGPPCQGFSRIGRGKLRSLQEHGVHAQADTETGDERNRLLYKYTLFVAALAPKVFLFENVRHFQAEVKTPEGTFKAHDVLAEAIRELSRDGTQYRVGMSTVDCSAHLIPQARERFVMAGIRSDVASAVAVEDPARWTLALPTAEAVPLRIALEGLPAPVTITADSNEPSMAEKVDVSLEPPRPEDAQRKYLNWVRQPAPPHLAPDADGRVDGHVARPVRRDDADWFAMMGPGKRWLDYRCDSSRTLEALREAVGALKAAAAAARKGLPKGAPAAVQKLGELELQDLAELEETLDGSLSLRLLLESISPLPGELEHHLLAPGYLLKKEGKHGDWLARMDPERPSKTIVSHMGKDTYAYVHPQVARTISVREAARIQSFPDWFRLGSLGLLDAFRVVGNAVPPLLSRQFAGRVAELLASSTSVAVQQARSPRAAS